jgi:hypothetical protein
MQHSLIKALILNFGFVVVGLGAFWEVLHNSYVKGGLAVGALLGPGRGR